MATVYINADSGNDSTGDGTSSLPWLTLSKAYSSSTTGDTITVQAATATYTFASATMSDRIIAGASATTCVFVGGGTTTVVRWTISGTFTVSNLTFQSARASNNAGMMSAQSASSVISFTNCIFTNIIVNGGGGGEQGALFGVGTALSGTMNIIGCLFYLVSGTNTNFSFFNDQYGSNGKIITWNVFNNTIYITSASTINIQSVIKTGQTYVYKNNIFSTDTGIAFSSSTSGSPVYTGSATNLVRGYTSSPSINVTLTSDPLFIDSSNANFNLRPTSPCIDTGTII